MAVKFNPSTDIPSLTGKVILVTGGNSGLGRETILRLSQHSPSKIYLAARNSSKAQEAIDSILASITPKTATTLTFLELNLASFSSIKKAAAEVLASTDRLDILINNAGIMGAPPGLTEDGYEVQFGTNHMGHALLTKLLLPLLLKTAAETPNSDGDVRIINVSSSMHAYAPKEGLLLSQVKTDLSILGTQPRYGHSKLANVLFTKGLAKRYPAIKSVAIHPGVVQTNLFADTVGSYPKFLAPVFRFGLKVFLTRVEDGALNQLWAATATGEKGDVVKQGAFYYPVGKEFQAPAGAIVNDEKKADELWDFTEREFAEKGF